MSMDGSCVGLLTLSWCLGEWIGHAPVFESHKIQGCTAASDEEELHYEVIEGDPAVREVQIAGYKHRYIKRLGFER